MMQRLMFFSLFLLLIGSTTVEAKWWIFGQSQDEVATRFIYLNDISYEELGDQVTLYRDMLPAGRVEIRGRGQSGKNRIGAAEVSLDGGQSWQKIELSRDGSFYFRFTPDINREYDLALRLLDTSGKSNEVDDTRKKLTVSDRDIQSMIRDVLDAMITAYQFKNERDFMMHVDPDFAGDAMILERAIRKDFTILDQINMRYTLNSVVSGSGGKVFASIKYNRQVTVARNGEVLTDGANTEFIFTLKGNKAKVSAMKNPLIFGLTEKDSVATGDVNQPDNDGTLQVPDDGRDPYIGNEDEDEVGDSFDVGDNFVRTYDIHIPLITSFNPDNINCNVDIQFSTPYTSVSVGDYNIIVEESLNGSGSWRDVKKQDLVDASGWTGVDTYWDQDAYLFTESNGTTIYYRLSVERISTGERSFPSTVESAVKQCN